MKQRRGLLWSVTLGVMIAGCGQTTTPPSTGEVTEQTPPTGQPPIDSPPTDPIPPEPRQGEWPRLPQMVPTYSLQINKPELRLLDANIHDPDFKVPARFEVEGRWWNVMLGYRGLQGRKHPKKSFQIDFPDEDPFDDGVKRLELLAEWRDGGLLTQKTWFDLAAAMGLRVPRVRHVNLEFGRDFYGVMVEVEAVRKPFLEAVGFDRDSDIYRCGQRDCELRDGPQGPHQEGWRKRTNEDEPWSDLSLMISRVNRLSASELTSWLENNFEVDDFLVWLAVDAAIANTEVEDSRSFFILNHEDWRWSFAPWDLNNSLALLDRTRALDQRVVADRPLKGFSIYDPEAYERWERERGSMPGLQPVWNTLVTRAWDDPGLRARLIFRLRELLETRFRIEELGPRIDQLAALLKPHLARDPWVDPTYVKHSAEHLKEFVEKRREWLLANLEALEAHGQTELKIDRIGLDAKGEPIVWIHNGGAEAKELGGLYLTGTARNPRQLKLSALSVPPGGKVALRGSQLRGFSLDAERPEVALFSKDGTTAIDVVFAPELTPGSAHGRSPSGSESFGPLSPE